MSANSLTPNVLHVDYVPTVNKHLSIVHIKDRPIFRTDLQIRTTFGSGWVGIFTEMRCSDFKRDEKSVHPEIPYCFSITSHRSFISSFFLLPISVIFPLVNFLLGMNLMDE